MGKRDKLRILLIGPLPVLSGGATVSFKQLVSELHRKPNISLIIADTGRKNVHNVFQNVFMFLMTSLKLVHNIMKVDVVSFHASPRGTIYFGPMVYFITRIFNKPLIVKEFGGILDSEYENASFLEKKSVEVIMKSERVLLQTKRLMNYFSEKFPKANLVWYPNSRPYSKNRRRNNNQNSQHLKFIYLGHVKPSKGIFEILEAAHLITQYQFSVDIFGPLKEGITESAFSDNPKVTYRGSLDSQKIREVLPGYDVLLLPTYHEGEGYPGVILEAYMAGLPVITTNWISIPEIVKDGISGLLIPPKDSQSLADAMKILLSDENKLNELKKGVIQYKEFFNSGKWTDKFLELCYEVLNEKE